VSALVLAALLSVNPWSAPRFVAFGEGADWVLVNVATKAVEKLALPAAAADVALSPDNKLVAFVGDGAGGKAILLWDRRGNAPALQVSNGLGYVGEPAFSAAGDELYFSGNVESGAPGAHMGKSYAQIFRARAPDWKQEPVTQGRGCHFAPVPSARGWVWFHTWCMGEKWLELKEKESKPEVRLPPAEADYREVAASPDGKRLLIASHGMTSVRFDEALVGEWKLKLRHERTRSQPMAHPAWGANAGEILFEDDGTIWLQDAHGERALANIKGVL
jgi:hypothetical protein